MAAHDLETQFININEETQMKKGVVALCALAAPLLLSVTAPAAAQQWPSKPVRILVPFSPGGGTDIQARLLSIAFQNSTGQTFLVDNRTGGGGLIAANLLVESPPD